MQEENKTRSNIFNLDDRISERTTFNLSPAAKEDLQSIKGDYGKLTIKEFFESLCSKVISDDVLLRDIEKIIKDQKFKPDDSKRKTFVLSKGSIKCLNDLAQKYDLPRDLLVSGLIINYKRILEKNKADEKQKEKKAMDILKEFDAYANEIEKKLENLGYGDHVSKQFSKIYEFIKRIKLGGK